MRRRAVIAVAVMALTGCGNDSSRRVGDVVVHDQRTIGVTSVGCPDGGDYWVNVDEGIATVEVRVLYTIDDDTKCVGERLITLRTDLGDRTVVDGRTGEALRLIDDSGKEVPNPASAG